MKNYDVEKRVEELLAKMTLAEKIGQLNQISSPKSYHEGIAKKIRNGQIGSFIMATTAHAGNDDTESVEAKFLNELQRIAVEETRLGIPVIFGRDVIHGHRTVFPVPIATAASFDEELVKTCYRDVAKEAARDGVHWTFSPMLDMSRDPRWGRCVEGPGEDPYLGAQMGKATVEGFQGEDLSKEDCIAACAKHYIGYGASEGGRDYHRTEISDFSLRNYYLPAFKATVDCGVQTVMSAFCEISGQPASSSRYLLTDVLKEELGFDGFVVSDWTAIPQIKNQGVAANDKEATEQCFNAGLDMDMVDECYLKYLETLIQEGRVSEAQLDDSVRRILRVKFRLGLFENPYIPQYKVDYASHRAHARKMAAESMVLLKNDNHILPLAKDASVTLMGPYANEKANLMGTWALDGKAEDVVSVYEGIQATVPECSVKYNPCALDDEAVWGMMYGAYRGDYAVVCLGESRFVTGEANSVAKIELNQRFIDLVKAVRQKKKPVIAVLFYGRPVSLEEIEPYCDAILWCWHPGTEGGTAVADVLFGNENPGGKLPMTLPRSTGQIPLYYNVTPASRTVDGYYKLQNCRNYHDCPGSPMYPFGYGLSYSEFQMDNVQVKEAEMSLADLQQGKCFEFSLDLTNLSEIDGNEVVQLYVRDVVASLSRPIRELKRYQKVFLSGKEQKQVKFEVGYDALGFYRGDGKFAVEPGEFQIYIGNNCYADRCITVRVV